MTTKHTPGPWYYKPDSVSVEAQSPGGYNYTIVKCGESYALSDGEMKANARLIAATPDLLAALEAVINEADGGWLHESSTAKQARAAIAKARGEA